MNGSLHFYIHFAGDKREKRRSATSGTDPIAAVIIENYTKTNIFCNFSVHIHMYTLYIFFIFFLSGKLCGRRIGKITVFIIFLSGTLCGRRVGLVTGDVYDFQLESSTRLDNKHITRYGRLFNPDKGWCARKDDPSPWFQVSTALLSEF